MIYMPKVIHHCFLDDQPTFTNNWEQWFSKEHSVLTPFSGKLWAMEQLHRFPRLEPLGEQHEVASLSGTGGTRTTGGPRVKLGIVKFLTCQAWKVCLHCSRSIKSALPVLLWYRSEIHSSTCLLVLFCFLFVCLFQRIFWVNSLIFNVLKCNKTRIHLNKCTDL